MLGWRKIRWPKIRWPRPVDVMDACFCFMLFAFGLFLLAVALAAFRAALSGWGSGGG